MRALSALLFLLTLCTGTLKAQTSHYWIYFRDQVPAQDTLNRTVSASYLKSIEKHHIRIIGTSKWFYAAYGEISNRKDLEAIRRLPMVRAVEPAGRYNVRQTGKPEDTLLYGQAFVQNAMLGLDRYHSLGYTGKGVTIALFDGGFFRVDSLGAFDSLRKRGGILATRDFVAKNRQVYDDDAHGMYVLPTIAGFKKDSLFGTAPDARFILARTEDVKSETHMEEFNWIKAMEWADSIGVDIIHSSLGYSKFDSLQGNYTYQDMDGNSTIITRAAEMAFQRGIFISNSAGNEGENAWKYITAPCDGKNVLCVGAVDSFGRHAGFSSFGPSADGRVKPDVMALGKNTTIISTKNFMRRGSGTSFSGPVMAGFVACLKQSWPQMSNATLLTAIRQSGDRYMNPSDSMGYGIPDIIRADSILRKRAEILTTGFVVNPVLIPNPARENLTIKNLTGHTAIRIFDAYGRVIVPEISGNVVSLQNFAAGLYIIEIGYKSGEYWGDDSSEQNSHVCDSKW